MASYQELEARIRVLEDRLEFVMTVMKLPVPSKTVGADGQPRMIALNLRDLYFAHKSAPPDRT